MLKSDGTLQLQGRPDLPPGRVRVTLGACPQADTLTDGVLDEPMRDPWAELPLPETKSRLRPKFGDLPMPDPPDIADFGQEA